VSFFSERRYSAAIASLALVLFALLGLLFLMTQYLQFVLGFSAFRAGLAIGPVALAVPTVRDEEAGARLAVMQLLRLDLRPGRRLRQRPGMP